jgi:hypothetical protein
VTKARDTDRAADLMRRGGTLTRMNTHHGPRWFIVPGGEIPDKVARRPDIQPSNDGLFPGISQTFRLGARA